MGKGQLPYNPCPTNRSVCDGCLAACDAHCTHSQSYHSKIQISKTTGHLLALQCSFTLTSACIDSLTWPNALFAGVLQGSSLGRVCVL